MDKQIINNILNDINLAEPIILKYGLQVDFFKESYHQYLNFRAFLYFKDNNQFDLACKIAKSIFCEKHLKEFLETFDTLLSIIDLINKKQIMGKNKSIDEIMTYIYCRFFIYENPNIELLECTDMVSLIKSANDFFNYIIKKNIGDSHGNN